MKTKIRLQPIDDMVLIQSGHSNNLTITTRDNELAKVIEDYILRKFKGIKLNITLDTN